MDIKFYWNGSFVGHHFHMEIDGREINLGLGLLASEKETKEGIKKYLKEKYDLNYTNENIEFVWGGCL